MDVLYLIERDFGKFGIEFLGQREWTRSKVVDLCAFEYRNAIKIIEVREDDGTAQDITEEIMREADAMRADFHQEAAE